MEFNGISGKSADRGIALEAWPLLTGVLKPGSTGSRYCNSKMKAIQCQQTKTMLAALSNSTRNSTHCVVIPQPGIDGNGSQRGGVTRGDPLAPIPISQSGNTRLVCSAYWTRWRPGRRNRSRQDVRQSKARLIVIPNQVIQSPPSSFGIIRDYGNASCGCNSTLAHVP